MWKRLILVSLCAACLSSCKAVETVLIAQSLPLTATVAWTANPASDNVTSYSVQLDSQPAVSVPATSTTQTISIATVGSHTVSVTAVNQWGSSAPATLTFSVQLPTTPANLKVTKQ